MPAGPAPSILGNNAADGWAASEPAPPATIDKLKATLAAEVAKADESTKMATEDAPQDGMAAHDKAAAAAVAAMAAGRAAAAAASLKWRRLRAARRRRHVQALQVPAPRGRRR